jgi:hypothetical protein
MSTTFPAYIATLQSVTNAGTLSFKRQDNLVGDDAILHDMKSHVRCKDTAALFDQRERRKQNAT